MKQEIKKLRVMIDGLSQLTKELKPINKNEEFKAFPEYINSQEIEKTYDSLILAKAWLGKVLGELGESTPYNNDGKRKHVKDIEPTTDTGNLNDVSTVEWFTQTKWLELTHIEKVDWLRQEIEKVHNILLEYYDIYCGKDGSVEEPLFWVMSNMKLSLQYLSEARFWLGFELQRIKENK